MRPEATRFPACWWGCSLEKAGLPTLRPRIGTYGRYAYEPLPPVPSEAQDLAWLEHASPHRSHVGQERVDDLPRATAQLRATALATGLALPDAFLRFIETPELHPRVRSNTDCFLDVCDAPVPLPTGDGHVVRFLADSQSVLFWYLYFPTTGQDHAVLASGTFYGTPQESWQEEDEDEEKEESPLEFVAESFEHFLWRFWVENELWFAVYHDKTTPVRAAQAYLAQYRARGEERE
jgi:hypothetical protein